MPRHEPSSRPDPGEIFKGPIRVRRDAQGQLQAVEPEVVIRETTEARPRPPQAEDPRPNALRDIGPAGGFA